MKKEPVALILAAGVGKRFWPFIGNKATFPFGSEAPLIRTLKALSDAGLKRFVIVVNHDNEHTMRDMDLPHAVIQSVIQDDATGMGDAVRAAAPRIRGNPVLIVNAADQVDPDLYETVVRRMKKNEPFVTGKVTDTYFDGGYLKTDKDRLTGIVEKPGAGKEPGNLVNLVFHYFPVSDDFLAAIDHVRTSRDDLYETALDYFIRKFPVSVLKYEGLLIPVKYPWNVLDLTAHFLRHSLKVKKGSHVEIRNNVSIEGPVFIGDRVRIFENTKIIGPTYIGSDTIVGNNNIIRESFIGAHSVTGFNTDITRSYIGEHCWFHSNYVGDSVLERNVSMGSGSVLANLRLDEGEIRSAVRGKPMTTGRTKLGAMIGADVRLGVNVSVMPGVKIGSQSMIGAGVTLDADIPDQSFVVLRQKGYTVKKNTARVTAPESRTVFRTKL